MKELKCPNCGKTFQVDEAGYASILKQVRDEEFSKELKSRESQFEAKKKDALKIAKLESEQSFKELLNEKEAEISELKIKMNKEILDLKNQLESFDKDKKIEINDIILKKEKELEKKNSEIVELKGQKEIEAKEFQLKEQNLKEKYEDQLKLKDEQIAQYKDFKARLSTKMIGESLEQHCENSFNQLRATGFSGAYFEKDNVAKEGSKGDYIFRDYYENGEEYISIMFDMKNEADDTEKKHKNEEFFSKLDKDRKNKKCEYAILVSTLEPESELYNSGIVDVSHKYEKMYVIRPQFFIPMITLLRNAALNSIEYRKELSLIKAQNVDITNFEDAMNEFKEKFSKNIKDAGAKHDKAIEDIDKVIKSLQNIRDFLTTSNKHLNAANNKIEDLSIKKLTKNNPTMQAKFNELKKKK